MDTRVIRLQIRAPNKPAVGEPCNGCGWCCLAEPCPLGMIATLRRRGPCKALRWDGSAARYRCGWLEAASLAGRWPARLAARWISAGSGCDAHIEPLKVAA